MSSKNGYFVLMLVSLCIFVIFGCSDDSTTGGSADTTPLDILDLEAVVEKAAPPEYTVPVTKLAAIDSIWIGSETALLPKVFGSHEPQSLYGNIEQFVMLSNVLENSLEVDVNYAITPGTYVDSMDIEMDSENLTLHYTASVTALTGVTAVPSDASEIIGASVDLDYLITVLVTEMPDALSYVGVKVSATEQTFLQFGYDEETNKDTYKTVYASMDPTDSSFVFKGVGFVAYDSGERFSYVFTIGSEQNGDFSYRNSWYSNGDGGTGPTHLHCVIGGGDKDTEYAMSYQHYSPADTSVVDSTTLSEQLFGSNFTEGTGLITDYDEFIEDSLFYNYDLIPSDSLTNPFE